MGFLPSSSPFFSDLYFPVTGDTDKKLNGIGRSKRCA